VVHWKAFKHGDKEYDLCHLHPKTVSYMQPAKGINPPRYYKVDVIFSLHCFTRGMEGETPDPELLYSDYRETRIFDFERYGLSHHLPGIVDGLMNCKCFHTDRGNFFTVQIVDEQGKTADYEVYFTASKSSKAGTINLFVQSAYTRDYAHRANRPQRKCIGFAIILYNIMNKIQINVPK
jgi:hypothetical protein